MSGLLRRLTRRRPATADETGHSSPESSEPAGAPAETPAEPGGGQSMPAPGTPVPDEQATEVLPATGEQGAVVESQPASARDLPAGIDPGELANAPIASASRGKLRRRLRYLRRVRELLLRDLGGFAFEIHRTASGTPEDGPRRLLESKASRIAAVDAEVRGLEGRLAEPHEGTVLREPGIGGLCPECGELHASDAHYCARCGAPLDAKARARRDAAAAPPPSEQAPASLLWAAGPQRRAAEDEKSDPSAATSEWLALPQKPADEPAAPKQEEAPPADEPDKPADDEFAPNGKRGEDVPLPPPDALGSRREPGA